MPFNPQQPIDLNRPLIKNPDQSFSTEKTITIEADGKFFNIPTIVEGLQLSDDAATQQFFRTGQHMGEFFSLEEALNEAQRRSQRIGELRGQAVPLQEGSSRQTIRDNIKRSRKEGKPLKQAIAIALEKAGKSKKKEKESERGRKALTASTRG